MDRRRVARIVALVLFALMWAAGLVIVWKATEDRAPETEPPATAAVPDSTSVEQGAVTLEAIATPLATPPSKDIANKDASKFGTLRGRVFDAVSGAPVPEFVVEFQGHQATKHGNEFPGARTFKSKDGRFEWAYVTPGSWMVTVDARGYQRFVVREVGVLRGEATREVPVPLRRGLALRGRVYDEGTGVGIAGASLSFRESGTGRFDGKWRTRARSETAKDGSFVLDGLPAGRVTLEISAHGYAADQRDVQVEGAGQLEIALSAGGSIRGRFTAADGATPVSGMVSIMNLELGFGGGLPVTGEFSFTNLAPGRYQVTGESEGSTARPLEIALAKNERAEGLVLSLTAGRTIRGRVSGLPAEQRRAVRMQLMYDKMQSQMHSADVSVDESGSYVFHGVPPGEVQLGASAPKRAQMWKSVTVSADADVTVDFHFPVGFRIYGRVTRNGRPVPYVEVHAVRLATTITTTGLARTSETGEYAIEGLESGEYRVRAATQRARVYLTGDTELDFALHERHLSGHVFEADGQVPVVGARVDLRMHTTSGSRTISQEGSDHYGAFSFFDLQPGDIALTVYKPGYEMLRQTLSFNDSVPDMTLKLRRDPGVEIRARDATTGKGLRSVFVGEMIKEGTGSSFDIPLDADGVGRLPGALAGSRLTISSWGYAEKRFSAWDGLPLDLQFTRAD